MARRSILSPARQAQPSASSPSEEPHMVGTVAGGTRPSRMAKLHVGGYFDPQDPTVVAFQKLKVDLRRSQQDMLMEALRDFVAKHEAASAFRKG